MRKMVRLTWLVFAWQLATWGQSTPGARIIVTMGHYFGNEPPTVKADDLTVTQNNEPVAITGLTPLRGDRAGLELFVLVDNCSSCEVGSKFDELRRFIAAQPPTTSVGVAYIQDGRLQVAENLTLDRERVIQALSPPGGSKPSSPYNALTALIEGWKQDSSRRVVLMISTGLDPAAGDTEFPQSKSAEAAIEAAQRAEVTVYAIYHPSADYATSDFSKLYAGQVQLSHVADETGGEAYFLSGFEPLPSLAPFLTDINQHLANQYLLEFRAKRAKSPGELQDVEVRSKLPDVDLMAPYRIALPESALTGQKAQVSPGGSK